MMSGKKFVLLISFIILVIIIGAVYFTMKSKNGYQAPPVGDVKTPAEVRAELEAFRPDGSSTKTPAQVSKELSSFKAPASKTGPNNDQILKDLQNIKP